MSWVDTTEKDRAAFLASAPFREWVGGVVLHIRAGFWRDPVGYRTQVRGLPRVEVRTKQHHRALAVDFDGLGDDWSDGHYHDLMVKVWIGEQGLEVINRLAYDEMNEWSARHQRWWLPRAVEVVEAEVGNHARWLCRKAFDAARLAWKDPEEAERLRTQDTGRCKRGLKRYVRFLLKAGIPMGEIQDMANSVVVEDVMRS